MRQKKWRRSLRGSRRAGGSGRGNKQRVPSYVLIQKHIYDDIYVYIYYTYVYTCIHMICIDMYVKTMYVCTYICTWTYTYTCIYTHIRMHIHTQVYVYNEPSGSKFVKYLFCSRPDPNSSQKQRLLPSVYRFWDIRFRILGSRSQRLHGTVWYTHRSQSYDIVTVVTRNKEPLGSPYHLFQVVAQLAERERQLAVRMARHREAWRLLLQGSSGTIDDINPT